MEIQTDIEKVTDNRFEENSTHINSVRKEVRILEDWLDIHPFPPYKHGSVFIKRLLGGSNSQ